MASPPRDWALVYATNATDATFPSRVATVTEPVDAGVHAIANGEDTLELMPFGLASDNHTLDMRVIGWRKVSTEWCPYVICQVALTHCAAVGVVSTPVINTNRFCDTISLTKGTAAIPTIPDDTAGVVYVGVSGFEKFEVTFDLGSGTNANALYALY